MFRLPATNEMPPAAIPRSVGDRQGKGIPGAGGKRGELPCDGPRNRGDIGTGASSLFFRVASDSVGFLTVGSAVPEFSLFDGLVANAKVGLGMDTSGGMVIYNAT